MRAEMVSPPTPKWALMSRAISRGGARTGSTCRPVRGVQFVERVGVERVAGGDDEGAVVAGDREQVLAVDEPGRHGREHVGGDGRVRQVHELQPELVGEDREQGFFLDEPLVDEHLVGRVVGGGGDGVGGAGPVRRGEQAPFDERVEQLHVGPGGGGRNPISVPDCSPGGMRRS
jgi:hypothetical protein